MQKHCFNQWTCLNLLIALLIYCSAFSSNYDVALEFCIDYNKKAADYKDEEFYNYLTQSKVYQDTVMDISPIVIDSHVVDPENRSINFIKHFEWIYFVNINDNYHTINLQDTSENNILTKPWHKSTFNLKTLFYPIHLAKNNRLLDLDIDIEQYYATLHDYELLTIILNYQKLHINMDIKYTVDKSNIQQVTTKTLLKRFLQQNNQLIKKSCLYLYLTKRKKTFNEEYFLNDIFIKLIKSCPYIKQIDFAREYINDILIQLTNNPNTPYQIEVQNGVLDLSNFNLNTYTLWNIYYHNPKEAPPISNWSTFDPLYRSYNQLSIVPSDGPSPQNLIGGGNEYAHCSGIYTINLKGNPEINFNDILCLIRAFYKVKKIIVDPSVILTIPKDKKLSLLIQNNYSNENDAYFCKEYLSHFTINRKVLKVDQRYLKLIPYDTLSIKLSEKNANAKAIINKIYKNARNYYRYTLTCKLLTFILIIRIAAMLAAQINPLYLFCICTGICSMTLGAAITYVHQEYRFFKDCPR